MDIHCTLQAIPKRAFSRPQHAQKHALINETLQLSEEPFSECFIIQLISLVISIHRTDRVYHRVFAMDTLKTAQLHSLAMNCLVLSVLLIVYKLFE